jgi:hypothetical protein
LFIGLASLQLLRPVREAACVGRAIEKFLVGRLDDVGLEILRAVREAFRLGYKDLAFVKKDPGLDVLRSREDFKRLLEAQAAK